MCHQKGVEKALDERRVSDVVSKPGEDPRQAKEGFHVGIQQMAVNLRIDFPHERKEHEFESRLEAQKIGPEGILKVAKGYLAEHLGRKFQIPGRIVLLLLLLLWLLQGWLLQGWLLHRRLLHRRLLHRRLLHRRLLHGWLLLGVHWLLLCIHGLLLRIHRLLLLVLLLLLLLRHTIAGSGHRWHSVDLMLLGHWIHCKCFDFVVGKRKVDWVRLELRHCGLQRD
mmetsp:Transcript_18650/g.42941  ORF Transcript_18650/g.42941 Transcript_18650/m.42941 type:complete len:224 (+) Transcript_18650:1452-2123(+)